MIGLWLTQAAELDLTAAFLWDDDQRAGLGRRFLVEVDRAFEHVAASPLRFPEVSTGHRRALLRRFPYGVYFRAEETRAVVFAVLHLHRDPAIWRERLPDP